MIDRQDLNYWVVSEGFQRSFGGTYNHQNTVEVVLWGHTRGTCVGSTLKTPKPLYYANGTHAGGTQKHLYSRSGWCSEEHPDIETKQCQTTLVLSAVIQSASSGQNVQPMRARTTDAKR